MNGEQPTDGSVMLLQREIGQIPYFVNQTRRFDLKLQPNLVKKLVLHIRGLAECEATHTSRITGRIGMYPFIHNIQVRASNGVILKSVDPIALNALNVMENGGNEMTVVPWSALSDAAAQPFSFDISIPFENLTGFLPERTILNTNEFSEIALEIQWGAPADIALSDFTDPPLILTDVVCDIVALERVPLDMNDELLNRQRLVDTMQVRTITADFSSVSFDLPENTLLKTLLFYIEHKKQYTPTIGDDGAIRRIPLDGGILRARVEDNNGAHIIREMSGRQIQSSNQSYYNMADLAPRQWDGMGHEVVEVSSFFGNQKPGVYIYEFDKLHDFTSLYSTIGVNYPKLVLDCNALPADVEDYTQSFKVVLFQRQIITPAIATR